MIALLLLGCTFEGYSAALEGADVMEAWIDDFTWAGFAPTVGGYGGSGYMRARTVDGEVLSQPVGFSGFIGGAGVVLGGGALGRVDMVIPEYSVPADDLFGTYAGSLETFSLLAGYHSLRVRNASGVELEDAGLAAIMSACVCLVTLELYPIERSDKPDPDEEVDVGGDSGPDSGQDSGIDSGWDAGAETGGDDSGADDTGANDTGAEDSADSG